MNLRLFFAGAVLVTTASPISAQIGRNLPGRPTSEILDSLKAGRKRWAHARVASINPVARGLFLHFTVARILIGNFHFSRSRKGPSSPGLRASPA